MKFYKKLNLVLIMVVLLFSNLTAASTNQPWNVTIRATNELEPVVFGYHLDALDGYDEFDEFTVNPDPTKVTMSLNYTYAKMINNNNFVWSLLIGVPVASTTTLTWDTSNVSLIDRELIFSNDTAYININDQSTLDLAAGSHNFLISAKQNSAPVANDDSNSTSEDTAKQITLSASDVDGDSLTYSIVSNPTNGTVTLTGDKATYTPKANYSGADSFTFKANDGKSDSNVATVHITVTPVNDEPVASDGSATTNEDTAKQITLEATDVDVDSLSFVVETASTNGTVTIAGDVATYTPAANYNGADSFTFKANDTHADSNIAIISITVTAVNDAPYIDPVVTDITTNEDTQTTYNLKTHENDVDNIDSELIWSISGENTSLFTVSIDSNDLLTVSPVTNERGSDVVTLTLTDGSLTVIQDITITVTSVNDAPVASDGSATTNEDIAKKITLEATDVDVDSLSFVVETAPTNGTVTIAGDVATYTPDANYNGADSFTFKVNDTHADSNIATISITVTAVNDAPVADSSGPYTGIEGSEITFDGSGSFDLDGTIVLYDWDFGDGSTDIGVNPTHVYGLDGIYTVTLTVTDNGGATDSDSTTVVVGNIAPTVTILSPPDVTNDSTPLLHATFDQTAASFWYVIDGAAGTGGTNADNLTVILSEIADGQHTVKVYANNTDGNVGSATQHFLVDTITPSITIDQVISLTNDSSQTITGTFDESGSGIDLITVNGVTATISGVTYSATIGLTEGTNPIDVIAVDNAGNIGSSSTTIVLDTIAPALTIDQVTSPTNMDIQIITGTFTEDGSGIASITVNDESVDIIGNTYSAKTSLNEGSNTITVVATDNAGNVGEAEDEIVLDTTAPMVDSVTLNDTVIQSGASIEVNISATDANEIVSVTADGILLNHLTGDYYVGTITAGVSPVSVTVTDEVGNVATDNSATYTIDDDAPVIDSIILNDTVVQSGASIEVNVSVTDANEIVSVTADGVTLILIGDYYIGTITAGASPVIVNVTDEASNMATDNSATYTIDDDAPVIDSVTLNDTVVQTGASIEVNVSATDTNEIVTVTADENVLILTGDYYIGTITASDGPVIVNVTDEAGNTVTNNSTTYTIDNDAPTVTVTINDTVVQTSVFIEVNVSATDAHDIVSVTANGSALILEEDFYIGTITTGVSPVIVNVTDEAGNVATDDSATYIIDDDKPVVNIFEPQQNNSIRFVDNIVRGTVTDANFASAQLIVINETDGIVGLPYDLIIEEDGSFIERVEYAPNQNNTLKLYAIDLAGNFNDSYMIDNISVQNDTVYREEIVEQNNETIIDARNETDAQLVVNANVNTSINVTITAITNVTQLNNVSNSSSVFGERALGKIVEIHVDGINASNATEVNYVTVRMYYTKDDLDLDGNGTIEVGELNEEDLFIYWYNSSNSNWTKLKKAIPIWVDSVGRVDTGDYSGYMWAKIRHLSKFAMTAGQVPDDSPDNNNVVTSSGGGSGGGGGGGGGTSGEAYENIEIKEKYEKDIYKDISTNYHFPKNRLVGDINITGNVNAGLINVMVEVLRNTSTLVNESAPGSVYKNVNIWVGSSGFAVPKNIKEATITFVVSNNWLDENDISEIVMYRYTDDEWVKLTTKKIGEENGSVIYYAITNRFSPYAISGFSDKYDKKAAQPVNEPTTTITSDEENSELDTVGIIAGLLGLALPKSDDKTFGSILMIVGLVGVVVALGLLRRRMG